MKKSEQFRLLGLKMFENRRQSQCFQVNLRIWIEETAPQNQKRFRDLVDETFFVFKFQRVLERSFQFRFYLNIINTFFCFRSSHA